MSFKIAELSAFSKAKLGTDDDAIANVTGSGRIVQKNTYYGWVGKIFRMTGAKNANNAVRTELLRALGRAFEINEGIGSNREGKTTFSPRFMDRLSELLGPAFMREDFGIRPDGTVDSGKPLTKRRITAILDRAKLVGKSDYKGYDCDAAQFKYDYVSKKIESLPEDGEVRKRFDLVKKIMDFNKKELPHLITDNYMFDRSKEVSELNPAGYVHKFDEKGEEYKVPLLKIDDVSTYLQDRLGISLHINDNIINGKRNVKIDALEDPWHQILDYVGKVLKTFVSESLDLYIEAEEKDLEDKYPNAIGGACMEAKIENLMNFKCNYLLESGPAAVHDAGMPLQDCMGKEIKLLIEDEKDDSKMTWEHVAKKVKAKLVGQVRPIYTATVERDENDEITSVKYEPARDINGQPLVREVEPEDLDKIGKAVMATIVDGV